MSTVIIVDKNDKILGYAPLDLSHHGKGKHHRAFVTLLFNNHNRVLLQRRKHRLFDGYWDLTAISHTLRIKGINETYQEASDRALKKEMGIGHVPIVKIGAFNYFARDKENCENEYCAVLTGKWDEAYKPNKNEVYDSKWADYKNFANDIDKNPLKYTPWAREAVKILSSKKPSPFLIELEKFIVDCSKFSKKFFSQKKNFVKKYPKLISDFYKDLEEFSKGGKSIRPFFVYLGYLIGLGIKKMDKRQLENILPICLAYELIHNYFLIHDDIIDKSPIRRGRATIHRKYANDYGQHYGVSQAIVIGDLAYVEAIKLFNQLNLKEQIKYKSQNVLNDIIIETIYGQALDIQYSFKRPNLDDIWKVAELKTARYSFVGPLTIGAILAQASKSQIRAIERYGMALGKAFQLKDDILGVFGDEKKLGKSTLSDMREGKNTLLFYKTLKLAKGKDLLFINKIWGSEKSNKEDLKTVQRIMESSKAKNWCENQIKSLGIIAKKQINNITHDKKIREIMLSCADFVITREY